MKQTKNSGGGRSDPPALTPEARQAQLIAKAERLAEKKLEDGTASPQIIVHYLRLATEREKKQNTSSLPAFIVGDMNPIAPTEKAMRYFRESYVDSWQQAEADGVREGPIGSFNGFNPDANMETQSKRGDYIFYKGSVSLLKYKCIDDKFGGQYPSDHLPIMADFSLK